MSNQVQQNSTVFLMVLQCMMASSKCVCKTQECCNVVSPKLKATESQTPIAYAAASTKVQRSRAGSNGRLQD